MSNTFSLIMNFPLFSVVDSGIKEVPTQLNPIFETERWVLGCLLFIGFLLLALAKRLEPTILSSSIRSFFTLGTPESLQKFEIRFNSTGFILLSFNFLISMWVCFTLFAQHLAVLDHNTWFIAGFELNSVQLTLATLVLVLCIICYTFLGLIITSFLTGEHALIRIFISQSWANLLFFNYLFFALGIIWLLNSSAADYFFETFKILLIAYFSLRILKTIIAVLLEGITWYYIILYLCTLEILPIVILLYYMVAFQKIV